MTPALTKTMRLTLGSLAILNVLASLVTAQKYTATYLPYDVPAQTEEGQSGTNQVRAVHNALRGHTMGVSTRS